MLTLSLIGIGCGDPEQLTLAAIRAINKADLILVPRKGKEKSDLADLRRGICANVLTNDKTRVVEFDLPARDAGEEDYRRGVDEWHDAVAETWSREIAAHLGGQGRAALLIWGDPSLYDSSLRIAARLEPPPRIEVVPGVTSIQALCVWLAATVTGNALRACPAYGSTVGISGSGVTPGVPFWSDRLVMFRYASR